MWRAPCVKRCLVYFLCRTALVLDEDHLPLLLSFAKRAAGKWREIGAYLKFEDAILNKIETSISTGGPVACFTELLTRWLKRAPPKFSLPTLEALLEALREDDVGEERIAYNLEQELTSKSRANLCVPLNNSFVCISF